MKRLLFYMCMVVILPLQLDAQISTSTAQKYSLWTVVRTMNCAYMPPGSDGSSQAWNFTALTPLNVADTHRVQHIEATAGMLYPNASMVKRDGLIYTFYDYQTDGVYILGSIDSNNSPPDTMMYSNPVKIMKHPITYLNMYVDSFKLNDGKADSAKGYIIDTVESFGKLYLPHDTIENVIRMKFTKVTETTQGGLPTTITETSYQWYGLDYSSPILVIDSILTANTAGNNTTKSTYYLIEEDPVSVGTIKTERLAITGSFVGNDIVITSGLNPQTNYRVTLYNLSGSKVLQKDITGGDNQRISPSVDLTPSMYILSIKDTDNPINYGLVRLVKQ